MKQGQKIQGKYMGKEISGEIVEMRPLTVKTDDCFEYRVKLSSPISIFGKVREYVLIFAKFDGSPSSYTKYSDSIKIA